MDLHHIFSAVWRHKLLLGLVVLAAIAACGLSLYSPSGKPRGHTNYTAQTRVMADSAGFGLGRVELAQNKDALQGGGFDDRAVVISFFVDSDFVLRYIPKQYTDQIVSIVALPLQESAVIQIEVETTSLEATRQVTSRLPGAISSYFRMREEKGGIPQRQRVDVTVVQPATPPAAKAGMTKPLAILAFLLTFGLGLFLILSVDNLKRSRAAAAQGQPGAGAEADAEPTAEPAPA